MSAASTAPGAAAHFTYAYTERVIGQQTLPDTAEHRAALTLR